MEAIFVVSIHEVKQKNCQMIPKYSKWGGGETLYTSNSFKIYFQQDHDTNKGKATAYNWCITVLFLES